MPWRSSVAGYEGCVQRKRYHPINKTCKIHARKYNWPYAITTRSRFTTEARSEDSIAPRLEAHPDRVAPRRCQIIR